MEKRVLYGLVVILMYFVGSGFGQGLGPADESEWNRFLTNAQVPVLLSITSTYCGYPCVIVQDQVAQLAQTYGDKIKFYTADILLHPFFSQLYGELNAPTVIVFESGNEIVRYENIFDWGNIYNLVSTRLFGSAVPPPS
ncbi:unnamed protein product [Microthlaspi erraticum]|uniref:Thioredoxin domain-containing protein n=1 Tax=Microthlaspi erraticum TaxID=1685480 RepID=A0A6D2HD45_9BRAS|nr:unnamed protein product [Microthlaspi erraticum]